MAPLNPRVPNLSRPGSESYHFYCANVIFETENWRGESCCMELEYEIASLAANWSMGHT